MSQESPAFQRGEDVKGYCWHNFGSKEAFEWAACRYILDAATHALTARGIFRIVLAGGNTPRGVYQRLRKAESNWSAWHVYFGDERCLPSQHPERNSTLACSAWLDYVAVPTEQIYVIRGEWGPKAAADGYVRVVAEVDVFDLALLGLGEDGHTASLFPGGAWSEAAVLPPVIPVCSAPKPPSKRVTLSPERLSQTRKILFLVSGANKAPVVTTWQAGADMPASRIRPHGSVDVFLHVVSG